MVAEAVGFGNNSRLSDTQVSREQIALILFPAFFDADEL